MRYLLLFIFLFSSFVCLQAEWNNIYGGEENDFGNAIISINDGYIVVGQTDSFGNGKDLKADAWIMRLDKNGEEIWNKTYGLKDEKDGFYSVILKDDQIVAVGYSHLDMVFVKFDMNGELLSEKIIDNEIAANIQNIIDDGSGFVIVGMGRPNLLKIDYDGNFVWGKKYGDQIKSVILSDNGYVVVGNIIAKTVGIGIVVPGFMIYALDNNGNVLYDNPYSKSDLGVFNSVTLSTDDGLVLAGKIIKELDGVDVSYSYVLKLNGQTFGMVWELQGKEFSSFAKVIEYDNAFFACGNSNGGQDTYLDFNLSLISSEGVLAFEDIFGGSAYDYPSDMIIDGTSLLIIGQSERDNSGKRFDMEIIHRDIDNIVSVNEEKQCFNVSINPNPITRNSIIEFDLETSEIVRMNISDIQGRIIHQFSQRFFPAGHNFVDLPYDPLNSSVYFLNIKIGDKIICRKIMSEK